MDDANPVRVISWNLLHTGGASLAQLCALIAAKQPDLLLMQEATAQVIALPAQAGGHVAFAPLPGRHHGLAAWSVRPLTTPPRSLGLPRGLVVRRVCQLIACGEIMVANVHLSHGQWLNRRQLRCIAHAMPGQAAILGDCNMVGAAFLPGFADAGPRQPTHRSARIVPLRLDRCFLRGLTCVGTEVLGYGGSDHRAILVDLAEDDV
jgi:endonuclease/exonuclease/phosphatase (EEP) superfamily protein YafD